MKVLLGLLFLFATIARLEASSHGEAPLAANFPQTDVADLYVFRSTDPNRTGYVTMLGNWNPRQLPEGGPNFYSWDPKFSFDFFVDNTGDGVPQIRYQFIFNNELPNNGSGLKLNISGFQMPVALKVIAPLTGPAPQAGLNYLAYYRINQITPAGSAVVKETGNGVDFWPIPFDYAGNKTIPGSYQNYSDKFIFPLTFPGCTAGSGQVFVGQRQESFSINLGKVFDLVNFIPIDGTTFPGGITQNSTNNVLRFTNIGTVALEVPTSCLIGAGNGVIGVWTGAEAVNNTAFRANHHRQKSRMANPLVNELFTGLVSKDRWNELAPAFGQRLNHYVFYPTFAVILNSLFLAPVNSVLGATLPRLQPNNLPRKDLIHTFLKGIPGLNALKNYQTGPLQDLLRLNTTTPITAYGTQNSLGVIAGDLAGFPNGRRPGDDIVDIALRVLMGKLCYALPGVYCGPANAPTGNVSYTDGSPIKDTDFFYNRFPYLNPPVPGSQDVPCSSIQC